MPVFLSCTSKLFSISWDSTNELGFFTSNFLDKKSYIRIRRLILSPYKIPFPFLYFGLTLPSASAKAQITSFPSFVHPITLLSSPQIIWLPCPSRLINHEEGQSSAPSLFPV